MKTTAVKCSKHFNARLTHYWLSWHPDPEHAIKPSVPSSEEHPLPTAPTSLRGTPPSPVDACMPWSSSKGIRNKPTVHLLHVFFFLNCPGAYYTLVQHHKPLMLRVASPVGLRSVINIWLYIFGIKQYMYFIVLWAFHDFNAFSYLPPPLHRNKSF